MSCTCWKCSVTTRCCSAPRSTETHPRRDSALPTRRTRPHKPTAGRAVEALEADGDELPLIAELVEPGLGAADLLERIQVARHRTRAVFDEVVEADSITALED